jgi:2-methylisocitrate lyase-like PEP mutase family enzyme
MPNAFDRGSARILTSMGFRALATTSSGAAATRGLLDGALGRDESLENAAAVVSVTELPVSADMENGFGASALDVAHTVRMAIGIGLAGLSIEDFSGAKEAPIFAVQEAAERVTAAAEAAHNGSTKVVLTARAENYLHGRPDLADTIARLQAFQEAGADVLFAPGLDSASDLRDLISAVDLPVNVLLRATTPSVSELAEIGIKRISVGGAFAFAAYAGLIAAASEFRDLGTTDYLTKAAIGRSVAGEAFMSSQ